MSTSVAESFDQQMTDEAKRIEVENPRWLVVFGVFTKQFVAYPCFPVPPKTMAVAAYPPALIERMRIIETTYGAANDISGQGCEEEPRDDSEGQDNRDKTGNSDG